LLRFTNHFNYSRTTSSGILDEISIEDWTLDSTTISYSAAEAELEAALEDEVPEELYTYVSCSTRV